MIFVRNARGVSVKSLAHISQFPRLDTFCVMDTSIELRHTNAATDNGWNSNAE